jgi:hypothetical protein
LEYEAVGRSVGLDDTDAVPDTFYASIEPLEERIIETPAKTLAGVQAKALVLRAYQLARSGACASLGDIEERLRSEGFHPVSIQEYLAGSSLRANLTMLCEETKGRGTVNRRT